MNDPLTADEKKSLESSALSNKQYILVNLSKCMVELVGTTFLGVVYLLIGDQ
jgi:hypothetical protein